MGLLFMIVVGAVLGWLAAIILEIEVARGILFNIAAGIIGALVAGLLVGPLLLGTASLLAGYYRVGSLLLSLAGSVALIGALNLLWPKWRGKRPVDGEKAMRARERAIAARSHEGDGN
jgi:uncharacterized membrane protein YeaQ/YmgE (transglycosylase-associated protein family)